MPKSSLKDKLMKNLPWLALGAGIIAACTCTALGSTILKECEMLSVFAQKMTSIMGSVMEKVPWPQPHHGEEGLWQTIAILATSVLVSFFNQLESISDQKSDVLCTSVKCMFLAMHKSQALTV